MKNTTMLLKNQNTISNIYNENKTISNRAIRENDRISYKNSFGKMYNGNCRQIICLETQEIFPSMKELSRNLNVSASTVTNIMSKNEYKDKHYIFCDDFNKHKAEIIAKFYSKKTKNIEADIPTKDFDFYRISHNRITDNKVHKNSHAIMCIDTFTRYPSIAFLAKKLKMKKNTVSYDIMHNIPIKGMRYIDLSKSMYRENEIIKSGNIISEILCEIIGYIDSIDDKVLLSQPMIKEAKKILKK